jgi:C4-dicarboxylate-binding protein DctP
MWLTRLAVALFCLVAMTAISSRAEEPILIRFSHVVGANTPKGLGAEMFKKRVEEKLAGKVVVEVYPRSQKFNDDAVFLALLFGDVEMAAPSLSKFRSYAPVLQVYDLPFLFRDVDHVHRFQQSEIGQQLLQTVLPVGIMGLAYWDNGMRAISANKPLRVPADADGLVFRIEPSMVFQQQWARVGVVGIPMPFSRVTDAIREGLVEGQENSWSNIYSRKIHELQENFTELNDSFQGYMVITNQDFWEDLPKDVRPVLEDILAEVTVEVNRIAREQAESTRHKVAESEGVEILTPSAADLALWREAMTPVWRQFEPEIGKEVIDAAVAAGGAS